MSAWTSDTYAIDLHHKQYSEDELIEHYCTLNNWAILDTQRLSADFCVRYILDVEERGFRIPYEEACIDDRDVLRRQPHLTEADLRDARERLAAELVSQRSVRSTT